MNEHQEASSPSAKDIINDVIQYLKRFVKNPILTVRDIPNWDWPTVLIFHTLFAATSGLLAGLIGRSLAKILGGLILFPVSSTVMLLVGTGFIYYTFLFWFRMEVSFKRLFTAMIICNLPFLALHTISSIIPPILIVGFAITGLLLVVSLVENFQAPKKHTIRLISGIFGVYIIFWVVNMISFVADKEKLKTMATPESIKILQQELSDK